MPPAGRGSACGPSTRCSTGWSTASCGPRSAAGRSYAISGGAALTPRLCHFFRGAGITVLQGWGLTETTAAATVNRPDRNKIGTVGQPLPGVAIKIGEDGEILVRGGIVFPGYWNNDEATKEAFDEDGWFRTGDIGSLDDEGFLTITGRKKEIIVTAGGKNVAPAVLEDRLRSHALISQAMVVGDGRPYVAALITLGRRGARAVESSSTASPPTPRSASLRDDPDLLAAVQAAVDDANLAVSRAESIRRFRVLDRDFTVEDGQLSAKGSHPQERAGQGIRRRHRPGVLLSAARFPAPVRPGGL